MIEICTSHFKENLEWLKKEFPVTVVHHEGGSEFPEFKETFVIPNHGYEASAFLEFIIRRYDSLPDFTAFIHGHETAEHQRVPCMLTAIRSANISKYKFIHLNNSWAYRTTCDSDNFVDIDKFSKLYPIPQVIYTSMGAQFIVSKDVILSRPIEFYKHLRDIVYSHKDAVSLEFTWHIIFRSTDRPSSDMFCPPIPVYHINTWIVPDPEKLTLRINHPPRDPSDPNMIFFEMTDTHITYQARSYPLYILKALYDTIYRESIRYYPEHITH